MKGERFGKARRKKQEDVLATPDLLSLYLGNHAMVGEAESKRGGGGGMSSEGEAVAGHEVLLLRERQRDLEASRGGQC